MKSALIILCGLALAAQGAKVTPMEKVISLLKDLSSKVAAEGAKEAAQYDKFACFCKEQADEKLYSIEKSDAKIADLKAEIKALTTAIADLNSDISDLSKKISSLEREIDTKTKKRAGQREEYDAAAKDMNEAISACVAALDTLKGSKSAMSGAKVDLLQKAVAKVKGAPKFEYQSNDIIATIEDLMATFKSMKKDLDFAEHDESSAFERDRLGLSNEKKFAEKDRAEKETIVEAKTEDLEAAKTDRDEEQNDRDADDTFMNELTKQCEEKAAQFDQRSSTRADELSTLHSATEELEKGAAPNFGSNSKLVGLQKASAPVSFVQLRNVKNVKQHAEKSVVIQQVRKALAAAADKSGSSILSTMAVRVGLAEDHFVKVRGLIKDLISKLVADAKSEATQKGVCDKGMKQAIGDRDQANAEIEVANAKITTLTAKKNSLNDEIDTLNGNIAELKKALLEATELRETDKAENSKTVSMSEDGAESVKLALGLLQDFYKNAFVQSGSKYTPPKADRDGNTVGDLAPEAFGTTYHGAQAESKGIVGILEVILSDFQRTTKTAAKEEKESKEAFEKFEGETNDDVDKKEKRIGKAEGEVADAESDILDQQQALQDGKDLLDAGLEKLESLEAMCVKGEETYAERVQKRNDEIEALKNALTILEEWQA